MLLVNGLRFFFLPPSTQDEREAREMVKREQDEAYRVSLEADRKKVLWFYVIIFFIIFVVVFTCLRF